MERDTSKVNHAIQQLEEARRHLEEAQDIAQALVTGDKPYIVTSDQVGRIGSLADELGWQVENARAWRAYCANSEEG